MTLILQISFAEKIKAEERVTFQKSFSSMADFRDVVSVLPAARLIDGFHGDDIRVQSQKSEVLRILMYTRLKINRK